MTQFVVRGRPTADDAHHYFSRNGTGVRNHAALTDECLLSEHEAKQVERLAKAAGFHGVEKLDSARLPEQASL